MDDWIALPSPFTFKRNFIFISQTVLYRMEIESTINFQGVLWGSNGLKWKYSTVGENEFLIRRSLTSAGMVPIMDIKSPMAPTHGSLPTER